MNLIFLNSLEATQNYNNYYYNTKCANIQVKHGINERLQELILIFHLFCAIMSVQILLIAYLIAKIEKPMAISYKILWKLLIDKDMKKKDLQQFAGISSASIIKLVKNENVNTEIIEKICVALQCDVRDIMKITED